MECAKRLCDACGEQGSSSFSIIVDSQLGLEYDKETAVQGSSKPEIANPNEEKDDSETPLKAPTGGFQHKHLRAGMFITVVYEVKGRRGSTSEKVYVGMNDTLSLHSVETAVQGSSKPEIANPNEEKDDSETPLKAPTGGFQHKHLRAGMFITVVYEVKGRRGSTIEKVYVGMNDTLSPHSVEVDGVKKLSLEPPSYSRDAPMALIDRVLDSSSHQLQKKALISFTPVSERIATIRLKESVSNLTIIHVYTLDSTRSDEECEQFYFQLQSVTDQTPKKDMLIVMGDFNTITGNDPIDPRDVMGPHGHGRLNGRGERLISFCRENDLYITNNAFKHRHRRKVTWRSHDGVTENMIDHVLISKRWKSSIMDTVSLPGKDFDSDHSLLMSKLKLRLKRLPKTKRIPRFRTELLRDPIKKASIPTQPPYTSYSQDRANLRRKWRKYGSGVPKKRQNCMLNPWSTIFCVVAKDNRVSLSLGLKGVLSGS
ncbi:hypothetical protein QYM36_017512 [Artemia franciscana]|uniref:Endonuclease/exonuclease/phosphatase domain-containing protein n=1 Tax=Artemia franciscana TaxID=6661 RepID=A0AA88HBY2_ARTSF|nr:hypothetical protein QYM36_017512 [Artemia franciscana]